MWDVAADDDDEDDMDLGTPTFSETRVSVCLVRFICFTLLSAIMCVGSASFNV